MCMRVCADVCVCVCVCDHGVAQAPRFEVAMPRRNPGPGHYGVDPVGGAMHTRTFNMTIAEEEQRAGKRVVHT